MVNGPEAEDKTAYYYAGGVKVPLIKDPTVFAVKYMPGHHSMSPSVSSVAHDVLHQASNISFIATYGINVYHTANEQAVPVLKKEAAIEYVSPGFRQAAQNPDPVFATNEILVQFKPEVTADQIAKMNIENHLRVIEALSYAQPNGFLLQIEPGETRSAIEIANLYFESGLTVFAEPNLVSKRYFKQAVAVEPRATGGSGLSESGEYLHVEWHLELARVKEAWEFLARNGYPPQGSCDITIGIADDGIDGSHPEFSMNLADGRPKVKFQYDFSANLPDGTPKNVDDNHGTACAGVATAGGLKAYGAAPGCRLMAVRTPDYLGVADEANMFHWMAFNGAAVISNSWGGPDGVGAVQPLSGPTKAALSFCVTAGRDGKGTAVFWAAGNGNESLEKNGQPRDGYACNPDVMAIAASTSNDTRAYYSDFGPEVFLAAPSSGNENAGELWVFTTDRHGTAGYNQGTILAGDTAGDYTNRFGGTSSATPLAAGIAALVLSVNKELTLAQLKDILRQSADRIGPPGEYDASGHSQNFGFGRINALRAVQLATGKSPTKPTVSGPPEWSRADGPPHFTVKPGDRSYYLFEMTSRPELFDVSHHAEQRTADNFYGSWADSPRFMDPTYSLPATVWDRLKASARLYYRVGATSGPTGWDDYLRSTEDDQGAQAPSLLVTADTAQPPTVQPAVRPTIIGPATASKTAAAPTFQIDPSPNSYYVVEVATAPELFDILGNGGNRTANNFYGSWSDRPNLHAATYTLPLLVWNRLKTADRLYYRVGSMAGPAGYDNYLTSTGDGETSGAPSIRITAPAIARDVSTVIFPSGAVFDIVDAPEDGVDYSDPAAGGIVPLIDLQGRSGEDLSRNFKAGQFASKDGARYARISPELVTALQVLRDTLPSALVINAGYQTPAQNQAAGDEPQSRHMAGQAADVQADGVRAIDLAQGALKSIGCSIGIGLGAQGIHIDVRGTLASWTYPSAEKNNADFSAWVNGICTQGGG